MPVVVGGGFGGVLFHEMTGHGLEADHVQKGASVYVGKLAEQVAQPIVTAYDDGRMPDEWGSDAIDDEGVPTQKTMVIEDGRLTSYLYDGLTARRDGVASTGNGRRESFRHLPLPRMTNTYIAPGEAEPEAMIAEVASGFYAVSFGGGQVDPATGDFVFGVSEGYLIEGGKVTRPCRGATLIGNCLQALAAIDAVGNDFEMKTGVCGKGGQKAPGRHRPGPRPDRRDDGRGDRGLIELGARARASRRRSAAGATDAEAYAAEEAGREVRVHGGEVESLTAATKRGIGVRAWIGQRVGYAFGTDLSEAGIAAIAARAAESARAADEDEFAAPPELPVRCIAAGDRRSEPTRLGRRRGRPGAEVAELALAVERAALDADSRVAGVEQAVYADAAERVAIASSTGIAGEYERTSCYAYLQALAEGDDGRETGLGFGLGRGPGALDPAAIGREGAERATEMIGAGKPESRSCPVVLDPTVAASFVGLIGGGLGAGTVQRGRSPFAGQARQRGRRPGARPA